ncbi:MAG: hypothetical protein AUG49_18820 [Catenulispora sp. 13_1_20CM_3_70_7]|nr:MAG: hypothetical protein AUG49_18820 [Catenulispora sp. 13_1_20CM_3_70_7]
MTTMEDLAAAVRDLVEEYPSDRGEAAGALVVGSESITLHPGHVAWIVRAIRAEMVTFEEAHPGGSGRCEHCGHVPAGADEEADDVDERERQDVEEPDAERSPLIRAGRVSARQQDEA